MEFMISVKKFCLDGSSLNLIFMPKELNWDDIRRSHKHIYPLLEEKRNTSDRLGWYSTCVITSASSSILGGFKLTS